jgi:hypothetical protein
MRLGLVGLGILVVTAPACAADEWAPGQEVGFIQCTHNTLDLRMRPAQSQIDYSTEGVALGSMFSAEGDEGLEIQIRKDGIGFELSAADIVWKDDQGLYMPDAAYIRVLLDGRFVSPDVEEAYEWHEWYPADDDVWYKALLAGERLSVEYLDEHRAVLTTRTIELAPLGQMTQAIVEANWTC